MAEQKTGKSKTKKRVPRKKFDEELERLQGELCNQLGTPYTVMIDDPSAQYTVEAFPAFGFMSGSASNLLTAFPSPTLDLPGMASTVRDVPIYVPPSLSQNRVARKLNIMVAFDSDLEVVESFAFRAGFERAQLSEHAHQPILLGVGRVPGVVVLLLQREERLEGLFQLPLIHVHVADADRLFHLLHQLDAVFGEGRAQRRRRAN